MDTTASATTPSIGEPDIEGHIDDFEPEQELQEPQQQQHLSPEPQHEHFEIKTEPEIEPVPEPEPVVEPIEESLQSVEVCVIYFALSNCNVNH